MREWWGNTVDSSTSLSGLRVALLLVGGSSEVFTLLVVLVGHVGELVAEEDDTQYFSEGDSIGG